MIRRFTNKRAAVGLGAIVAAAALAVGAFAYFTNTGTHTGTPVTVGETQLTGSWGVTFGATTYVGDEGAQELLPTALGDPNAVVATVAFTVANESEADELLSSYTVKLSGESAEVDGAKCKPEDFSVNGKAVTESMTGVPGEVGLPVTLKPKSDPATESKYEGSFTIQLVENHANQDACRGFKPTVEVSATS